MVSFSSSLEQREKEALLIMFGALWQKRFWPLDGLGGRPSISDCIDFAMRRWSKKAREDLVGYLENYLGDMSRRCEGSASKHP